MEIGCDWQGYQREMSEILRILALRIEREDRDLYLSWKTVSNEVNFSKDVRVRLSG